MYAKHTTEGFILKTQNVGEANKLYHIFTRDFGMVVATAQGVRLEKSKLRHALAEFNFCSVSLVRGREMWRLASAAETPVTFENIKKDKAAYVLYVQIQTLLKRLLHGEERNEVLFDEVKNAFIFLESVRFDGEMLRNFEYLLVLRILNILGYLRSVAEFLSFVGTTEWNEGLVSTLGEHRASALHEINASLKASHL